MNESQLSVRTLIRHNELARLKELLTQYPELANEGLPYDEQNTTKAHPLHRICDGVCDGSYSDDEAVELATLFLDFGANVDGSGLVDGKDSPLTAAASLRAEKVGLLYIDRGATSQHAGCYRGTALHWAAWVGLDKLVQRLIEKKVAINQRCTAFDGTPLLWAVHGYVFGGEANRHHQIDCVRLLLAAGADKTIPNKEGVKPIDMLDAQELEMRQVLV
ncbi:ankyrin repeat domain-containing protein [Spirosoma gilvum]